MVTRKSVKTSSRLLGRINNFVEAKPKDLRAHVENVRKDVIPRIKDKMRQKEKGAERVKTYKLF